MKSISLIIVNLLLTVTAFCQTTKVVEKMFTDSKQVSERYYVLESDGKTKEGLYVSYYRLSASHLKELKKGTLNLDDFITAKGIYKNNKKEGEWIDGGHGSYLNGKKIGIWKIYHGNAVEQFDYDNNKRLPPLIRLDVTQPGVSIEHGIYGVVTVSFKTHTDCTISDINITKGLDKDCNKAVMNAMTECANLSKAYGANCEEKTQTLDFEFFPPK